MQLDGRILRQFLGQILELDRQDIGDLERTTRRHAVHQSRRQVTVGTGNLQRTAAQIVAVVVQHGIAQALVIAPENQIYQPLPLEDMHRPRMDIGPPVMRLQIVRYVREAFLDSHAGSRRSIQLVFHCESLAMVVFSKRRWQSGKLDRGLRISLALPREAPLSRPAHIIHSLARCSLAGKYRKPEAVRR
jgi:hypothetical protein